MRDIQVFIRWRCAVKQQIYLKRKYLLSLEPCAQWMRNRYLVIIRGHHARSLHMLMRKPTVCLYKVLNYTVLIVT